MIGEVGNGVLHHLPRHRVNCRLTHRNRQTGFGHNPDSLAAPERHAAARVSTPQGHGNQRAMGHIRIIAGIFDDSCLKPVRARFGAACCLGNSKIGIFAARRDNCDAIRKLTCDHRRVGCIHGSGRAGACCPAKAESRLQPFFAGRRPGHSRCPKFWCQRE